MMKFILYTLLSILIFSSVDAKKNNSFSKGESYKGEFKWGYVDYKFPEGNWTFFHKANSSLPGTNLKTRCIEFYQKENSTLKGLFDVCEIVTGGKWTPQIAKILSEMLKNGTHDNCTLRAEYFYAQLFTKGTTMNCFLIRHIDTFKELNYPDDPDTRVKYLKIFFKKNNIEIPKTMILSKHVFFAPSIKDKGVEINYSINPEFFGAPKTLNGDENGSEYHRNNINNHVLKKNFINDWLSKQANYHQYFEKKLKAKKNYLLNLDEFITFETSVGNNNLSIEQLKSLNKLYKSGILSKDDFEKAKKKILN